MPVAENSSSEVNMTERLYEKDQYLKAFEARVQSCEKRKKKYAIVLDVSAFFPEGGGQPGDHGILKISEEQYVHVTDTIEEDGEIYHICDGMIEPGTKICAELDWQFRFDNMQNHAGEHIVSGLIHRLYGYDNVGFHMGSDCITLDLNGDLGESQIYEIEMLANEAVWADVPIMITIPDEEILATMDYRSKKALEGDVRIVEIQGYDLCACCGTHPRRTGEIGLIKLLSVQHYKGGVRIEMLAGRRALENFRAKHLQAVEVSRRLSVKTDHFLDGLDRVMKENEGLKANLSVMKQELMQAAIDQTTAVNGRIFIRKDLFEGNDLRRMADALKKKAKKILALSMGEDQRFRYVLIDEDHEVKVLNDEIRAAFAGRGGGSDVMTQGTMAGNEEEIRGWFLDHV